MEVPTHGALRVEDGCCNGILSTTNSTTDSFSTVASSSDSHEPTSSSRCSSSSPPEVFLCPISCQVMTDPVTIESSQTFDRSSIQQWFAAGHKTCPLTRQPVNPANLRPERLLKRSIQEWVRSQDGLYNIELADAPVEVIQGHFLLPAPKPQDAQPSCQQLVRALLRAKSPDDTEALIQHLLTLSAVANKNKNAIISTGIIPQLVYLVFSAETVSLRWYAAELISFLTTIDSALPIVLDSLLVVVPWVAWRMAGRGRKGMLVALMRRITGEDQLQAATATWVLWILSARQGDSRRKIVKAGAIQHMLRLLGSTHSDTCRIAAARVLRCLALVDRHIPLMEASGAVAALAVMLRTSVGVVKLAACCALSNVANSPRAASLNFKVLCSCEVLDSLREMILSDSLQARRTAAVLVKVLSNSPSTVSRLLEEGVLRCVVLLLQEQHEFYVGVVTATLEQAARHCTNAQLRTMCAGGAVEGLALVLNSGRAQANVQLDALRALQALLCPQTASYFTKTSCLVGEVWKLLGSSSGVRLRHQSAALLLDICQADGRLKAMQASGCKMSPAQVNAAAEVAARRSSSSSGARMAVSAHDAMTPVNVSPRSAGTAPLLADDSEEEEESHEDRRDSSTSGVSTGRGQGISAPLRVDDPSHVRWLMKLLSIEDLTSQYVAAALLKHLAARPSNRPFINKAGAVYVLQEVLQTSSTRRRWFVAAEAATVLHLMDALPEQHQRLSLIPVRPAAA